MAKVYPAEVRFLHEPRSMPAPKMRQEFSPFSGTWTSTQALLRSEAAFLGAREVVLVVDADPSQVRRDGMLRADARVRGDYVEVFLPQTDRGSMRFATGRFRGRWDSPGWQANVRAIALGMEALRKVRRYGIADDDQQYRGWQALPPGDPIALGAGMTLDQAAAILHDGYPDGPTAEDLLLEVGMTDRPWIRDSYRMAAKAHHPDAGGDPETFRLLTQARDLLLSA